MASSRKSRASSAREGLEDRVARRVRENVRPGDRVAIGLSGGVDSVALFDMLVRLARRRRFTLSAIHVNHQLSPNAGHWSRFCRALCRARNVPLRVVKVTVTRGDSLEAAARAARHAVFAEARADYIALAHNQDDQVETLLLQLLRGAGVRGLAAMPVVGEIKFGGAVRPSTSRREPVLSPSSYSGQTGRREARTISSVRAELVEARTTPTILRPLLDASRSEIEAYARARKLTWVEDESNAQTYFARNFLRHEVLPVIAGRYPAYRATIARAARNLADAAALLDDLARADASNAFVQGGLSVARLRRLSAPRARNLLRYFLALHEARAPAERLEEALRQALTARQDARVAIDLGDAELRRFAGTLHVVRKREPRAAPIQWHGEREVPLPELGGVLQFTRGRSRGISLQRLEGRTVTIGVRRGGERLKTDARRPRRSLKNLLQEARIPPWQRERTPLIFCDEDLVWAEGLGIDCAYRAAPNEPALEPSWRLTAPDGMRAA
jgi:tRNA(Ile)-lysidine synthase